MISSATKVVEKRGCFELRTLNLEFIMAETLSKSHRLWRW